MAFEMPARPAVDYRRAFHAFSAPYMILDTALRFLDMNDRYLEVTQRSREELVGRYVFDAFPETGERLAMFKSAFERAVRGEANSIVRKPFAIPRPESEGGGMREVWWTCHHVPLHDADGNVVGMVQHAEDLTVEVEAERMRDIVSAEFAHRVKNVLATALAIARQTARTAPSMEVFIADFEARIGAMARTHEALVTGGGRGMSLAALVEGELEPFRDGEGHEIVVSGPAVELSGDQAQVLGLAFHELTTNAAKYGALSRPGTRLEVRWSIDPPDGALTIAWREAGLDDLGAPATTGFGSTIIDRMVPSRLSASVERRFLPSGLACTIVVPPPEGEAPKTEAAPPVTA